MSMVQDILEEFHSHVKDEDGEAHELYKNPTNDEWKKIFKTNKYGHANVLVSKKTKQIHAWNAEGPYHSDVIKHLSPSAKRKDFKYGTVELSDLSKTGKIRRMD